MKMTMECNRLHEETVLTRKRRQETRTLRRSRIRIMECVNVSGFLYRGTARSCLIACVCLQGRRRRWVARIWWELGCRLPFGNRHHVCLVCHDLFGQGWNGNRNGMSVVCRKWEKRLV